MNAAIPTSNIIFVNVFYLLVYTNSNIFHIPYFDIPYLKVTKNTNRYIGREIGS